MLAVPGPLRYRDRGSGDPTSEVIAVELEAPSPSMSAFREFASLLRVQRYLILEMSRRAITEQFRGQVLGRFWPFLHPLTLVVIYVVVFGVIFGRRIELDSADAIDLPEYILAGLVPWLGIVAMATESSRSLITQANLVKQIVFPIEVLPIKTVIAGFFGQFVGLAALLAYNLVLGGGVGWMTLMILPLVMIQFVLMCGVALLLAVVTPFFRDLSDLVRVLTQIGIYLLPVLFLPAWVPGVLRPLLVFNPFSHLIWAYQDALFFRGFEHPWSWLVSVVFASASLMIGWRIFQRLRPLLGNVL